MKHARKRRTSGLDMCPYCISFNCDPMTMSFKFQEKVTNRRRQGLCPACGWPKEFCQCKSSMTADVPRGQVIRTHNNKKLRQARAMVRVKEAIYNDWERICAHLEGCMTDDELASVSISLYYHKTPNIPWERVSTALRTAGIDPTGFAPAWGK